MKKLVFKLLLMGVLALVFFSCNKVDNAIVAEKESTFVLHTDSESLAKRIHYINEPIEFQSANKSLSYNLVASIETTIINNQKLSATSVTGDFERAYVGFHTRGGLIGGELLSLDVSNPSEPIILQSAQSDVYEINDIFLSENDPKLWICGDTKTNGNNQAYAMEFSLDANRAHGDLANWTKFSPAFSGNSITETYIGSESHLWFTSGSKGGLEVFPSSNPQEIIFGFDANNTKHFDANQDYGVAVIGVEENLSIVRVYNFNNDYLYNDYEIPYTLDNNAKNGIFIEDNYVYMAMGTNGMLIMDLESGQLIDMFKNSEGMANSVYVEKDYIYVAYGKAGLFILNKETLQNLGNYVYEGSCNFVFADHDLVFISNGDGDGFLILMEN